MKALLIQPHKLIPASFSTTLKAAPPLGLAYIAGVLDRLDFDIRVYDCIAEAPEAIFVYKDQPDIMAMGKPIEQIRSELDDHYDLIGVSLMFTNNWLINRKFINHLKEWYPQALIVAGGEHASSIPAYCLSDCPGLDMVVVGEGEETMEAIARALLEKGDLTQIAGTAIKNRATGEIQVHSKRSRIKAIEEISRPAWNYFPLEKYFDHSISYGIAYGNSLPIFATRGCPYSCTFCSSPQMWGTKYSMRSVDDVIQEIKWLIREFEVVNIDFFDLTAIIHKQWILDFCRRIMEENIKITFQIPAGTRAEAIDYDVAVALREAGCKNITYAPESGSAKMLKSIKKKVVIDNMLKSIEASDQAGLNIKLNILLGYPDEKVSDVLHTMKFLIRSSYHGAADASPSVFSPYPGSALFQELESRGELKLGDAYFKSIVFSQSLHYFVNYNRNYPKWVLIILLFGCYLSFYASNYLFRPIRLYRLIRNVYLKQYQTRGEYMLGEILNRRKLLKQSESMEATKG